MAGAERRVYVEAELRVGMVSRPGGFEDSPEAEIISGGVSGKTWDAVAIGRHGNFLHWGFAASPDDMTGEARDVFANAVVYMPVLPAKRRSPANITTALSPGMILRFVLFRLPAGLMP